MYERLKRNPKIHWMIGASIVAIGCLSFFQYNQKAINLIDTQQSSSTQAIKNTLQKKGSLYLDLIDEGVPIPEVIELARVLEPILDPDNCPPGSEYRLIMDETKTKIDSFIYWLDPINVYVTYRSLLGTLKAYKKEVQRRIVVIEQEIKTSLYDAIAEAGQPLELATLMADIFAWQIDFSRESCPGDTFRLAFEEERQGNFSRPSQILIAQYKGKLTGTHTAVFFRDPTGCSDYYNTAGNSMRTAFLRTPVNYTRISSRFSHRRLHPVLRRWRPHRGIDYAAPLGTPIYAIGDGIVTRKGWGYDSGRYLKMRHPNGYYSIYAHLYKYAKGIKPGTRVHQGQIIAYVGSSGLSTGPHLYFAMSKDGKRVNFLKMEFPATDSINPKYRFLFNLTMREYLEVLDNPSGELPQLAFQ
jgi:murein DD-endopeptidase MepM/ murein hydrolase activator NlpD